MCIRDRLIHIVRGAKYIAVFDCPKISKHRALVQKLIQILHTAVYRTVIYLSLIHIFTTNSVTAEHMWPIMTPLTTSIDMLLTFLEMISTKPIESIAPKNAAAIMASELTRMAFPSKNTITSATTILAPDDMPSTKGPAIGL